MCGICGIYGRTGDDTLANMMSAMIHRGPDSDGSFRSNKIQLGMRRLKIIDLDGSEQPITNETGDIILVCNGEIYNYVSLRSMLQDRGHVFKTQGDVEVIVHLYEEYGQSCIQHLDGMFAFAIWDQTRNQLILARDRLGVKPLYYCKLPDKLIFASEIRSIIASGEAPQVLDDAAIMNYVRFPAIPGPLTIYQQIDSLLPGHMLQYTSAGSRVIEYWDVDFQKSSGHEYSPEESVEIIREKLTESVKKRLMTDVSLGAFLSGGIDSSAIVGIMGQLLNKPVKTYSIRFCGEDKSYEWFDDASFAVKIAKAFGTEHTELTVTGRDVEDQLLRAVWAMDQPSGDAIQYYIVSGHAARDVTVALSGTGGDEVFAGYEWFKEIRKIEEIHKRVGFISPKLANSLLKKMSRLKRSYELGPIRRKIQTLLAGRQGFSARYQLNRRMYHANDYYHLFSPDFIARTIDYAQLQEPRIEKLSERCEGLDPVTQMSYMQLKSDMVNLLVRDQDAVSMAHSLEVRLPMIDHKLIEAAARVPSDMKLNGDTEKYVLREAMKKVLPRSITRRTKKGFMFPMSDWMRNELKPVISSCLSRESVKKRNIFNPETVGHLVRDFYTGKQPFFKIWNLALFELWCRVVLDRNEGWREPTGQLKDYL